MNSYLYRIFSEQLQTILSVRPGGKRESGFTLIELVMVIVILGILAAAAVPRFMDLSSKAEQSTGKGVLGALASTASVQYAKNSADGNPGYPTCGDPTTAGTLLGETSTSGIDLTCSGSLGNYVIVGAVGAKECTWTYDDDSSSTTAGKVTLGSCT